MERDRRQNAEAEEEKHRAKQFDPYAVLNVPQAASHDEIKRAYREMMSKYHPDKVSHLSDEFQEMAKVRAESINRAYQMIKN